MKDASRNQPENTEMKSQVLEQEAERRNNANAEVQPAPVIGVTQIKIQKAKTGGNDANTARDRRSKSYGNANQQTQNQHISHVDQSIDKDIDSKQTDIRQSYNESLAFENIRPGVDTLTRFRENSNEGNTYQLGGLD